MPSLFAQMFQDKVVLVTGGGSGIGRTIAESFADAGAHVAVLGRTESKLAGTVNTIVDRGGQALALPADVRDPEALRGAFDALRARFGRLDVLVNSAAGNFLAPAVALTEKGFSTVVDIDLKGTFNTSKAAFPLLSAARGTIVNISATLQYLGTPFQVHACSAKAGIDAMTRTLAVEWGGLGIRVNGIAPGPIDDTEGMARLAPGPAKERMTRKIPLGRFGTRQEIANAALFLASPLSAYTTGAILVVDGGQWLASPAFDIAG